MPVSKMTILNSVAVFLGVVANGTLVNAAYSNAQSTETVGPQEIGSTTSDGNLIYSMNHCTIVHNTDCQVSLSTGGQAPPSETANTVVQTGTAPVSYGPPPSQGIPSQGVPSKASPKSSAPGEPTPGVQTSNVVVTSGATTHTSKNPQATASTTGEEPSGTSAGVAPTSTGGAAAFPAIQAVVFGAVSMAMAFLG